MLNPSQITAKLWKKADQYLSPGQVAVVIAADGRVSMTRSNLSGGTPALVRLLREIADKLEADDSTPAIEPADDTERKAVQ